MRSLRLINIYIAKSFLLRFAQITLGFSLLIFFINLIDLLERVRDSDAPFYSVAFMALLQIPSFLNDIVPSLVLISAIISFFLLSSKSEITIIRMSGFSLWQILRPLSCAALLLGIVWVTVFGSLSIQMTKKFHHLEGKYTRNETREVIAPSNGVWLKQTNIDNPEEELIIQSKKVYRENFEFDGVTFWFFNKDGQFYKKIDAASMILQEGSWLLEDATINDDKLINKNLKSIKIPTNLKADFVMQKVVNNFQNVQLFSIFELPTLITDLQSAGFNSTKFKVYLHSLLSKPLLFLAMIFIACYFGLNHVRNQNTTLMIFLGIVAGLILYIISSIINSLGSSGLIPIFASTWVIAIICLAIGTLLIYNKETL
jgi:lipopolysaccharide export system permease protein